MAIFIVENSGKVSYGIKRYICKTMEDIPVEVNGEEIAPGSRIYVSDEEKTYMLNTAGQWVEITEGGGGGGASSIDQLNDVTIASPQESQILAYDETNQVWVNVENSANEKMDKANPTGSGYFSLNRKANTIIGEYSFAEGYNTRASGQSSHAEGENTITYGFYSHAEGYDTTASSQSSHAEGESTAASGLFSHAEGYDTTASKRSSHAEGESTTASGNGSHAEGINTTASGQYSHAEGYDTTASVNMSHAEGTETTASGHSAHAEGYRTTASGSSSHSEGNRTIAAGNSQHVGGKYNIEDNNNTYAEIIGNGTADDARSNARTLDWSGNESLAGTIDASGFGPTLAGLIPSIAVASGTLTAGNTTVTISDAAITANSIIIPCVDEAFTGVAPTRQATAAGSVTLTFPVQSTDMPMKVVVI